MVQSRSGQVERVSLRYFVNSTPGRKPGSRSCQLHGTARVTLVYSSHDTEHNNAVALQQTCKRSRGLQIHSSGRGGRAPAVDALNPRDGSPSGIAHVRAASSAAVPARSHGVGTAASSTQSDGPLGWHHISACRRGGWTTD